METPTINDLMVPLKEYASVSGDATVFDAVQALEEARERVKWRRFKHRAVLVLDDHGRIVGKVRPTEVMDNLEEGYRELGAMDASARAMLKLDDIKAMLKKYNLWQKPLADICKQASSVPVTEIMHVFTEKEYIPIDAPLAEAIHQMVVGHSRSLLVTDNNEVVGVLRMTDVYSEICQMVKATKS
jgi:CBS domain-containing protein